MEIRNLKAKSVPVHDFAMNPSPEIKRSNFPVRQGNTVAFSFAYLVPLYVYDVLPGDHWNCKITAACRTEIPLVPVLDNWTLDLFAFYTPYRLVWDNFVKMMGEQKNPGDSIAYTVPVATSPANGYAINSLQDYLGLPTVGQVLGGNTVTANNLIPRIYNLQYDEWFRDENLQAATSSATFGDGPDNPAGYVLLKRGKRPDYFTTALPWPQKGNAASTLPLGTTATVRTNASVLLTGVQPALQGLNASDGTAMTGSTNMGTDAGTPRLIGTWSATPGSGTHRPYYPSNLYADLSTATAATVNQLRTAITLQQLLERDARGGTRYKEMVYSHFRVISPDARLDRPEYIGGGQIPITVNAVPQTSATGLTGGTAPIGTLGGTGYAIGTAGFSYAATEHGCIMVLASARADLRYSQGLPRMWNKQTRYDFYLPVLDGLGEQAILNKEIYMDGSVNDNNVFGYGPRWDEYRHFPSRISGAMKPRSTGNLAYWHSAQDFGALPTLNASFIVDGSDTTLQRNFSAGALSANRQIFGDFMCQGSVARSMSAYGVPGLTRL